jgi:hypothetical protein
MVSTATIIPKEIPKDTVRTAGHPRASLPSSPAASGPDDWWRDKQSTGLHESDGLRAQDCRKRRTTIQNKSPVRLETQARSGFPAYCHAKAYSALMPAFLITSPQRTYSLRI